MIYIMETISYLAGHISFARRLFLFYFKKPTKIRMAKTEMQHHIFTRILGSQPNK